MDESDNESNIIGTTFYGGSIIDLGGYEYQYTPSTNNTPLEDFILYKVSDGQLESEPALISFSIPWGRPGVFRPGLNNAVSQFVDTAAVLVLLCATGAIEWERFLPLLENGFLFKVLVALIDTPLIYAVIYALKGKIDIAHYDEV